MSFGSGGLLLYLGKESVPVNTFQKGSLNQTFLPKYFLILDFHPGDSFLVKLCVASQKDYSFRPAGGTAPPKYLLSHLGFLSLCINFELFFLLKRLLGNIFISRLHMSSHFTRCRSRASLEERGSGRFREKVAPQPAPQYTWLQGSRGGSV